MKEKKNTDWIVGRQPVMEVLKAGRPLSALLIQEGIQTGPIHRAITIAKEAGVPIKKAPKSKLDMVSSGRPHQGIAAQVAAHEYADLWEVIERVEAEGRDPFIMVLDGIEDPHNLGAIIRTAEATGIDVVVIGKRRSASLTSTVAKASAGAIEYVPVARVSNIGDTLLTLAKRGLTVVGSGMGSDTAPEDADLTGPLALVIGAEGEGMSDRATKCCDQIVTLPMRGKIQSLNASVAAALVLFAAARQRSA